MTARRKRSARTRTAAAKGKGVSFAARVRVYRQGIGDCILVTLARTDGSPFHILIDCGVMMVTRDKKAKLTEVIDDIVRATGGPIDVLVVTHEHYDHVAGFQLVEGVFDKLAVRAVWAAWTEDAGNAFAKTLRRQRNAAFAVLEDSFAALNVEGGGAAREAQRLASAAAGARPDSEPEIDIADAANIFAAVRVSTRSATEAALKSVEPDKRNYLVPHTLAPLPADVPARIYVLGPPQDEAKLNQSDPDATTPETFGLAEALAAAEAVSSPPGVTGNFPFIDMLRIPLDVAAGMAFFRQRYFEGFDPQMVEHQRARQAEAERAGGRLREPVIDAKEDVGWRRIEGAAFARAQQLALHLERHTNNTSLAFAIELNTGDVLLFPGDAQVGNALSWHDAPFTGGGETVTTETLLGRTVFYKVSHHGSHNGTLEEKGLDMMGALRFAAITIDEADARKLGWDRMPLAALVEALERRVKDQAGAVVRTDRDVTYQEVRREKLFYEFTF